MHKSQDKLDIKRLMLKKNLSLFQFFTHRLQSLFTCTNNWNTGNVCKNRLFESVDSYLLPNDYFISSLPAMPGFSPHPQTRPYGEATNTLAFRRSQTAHCINYFEAIQDWLLMHEDSRIFVFCKLSFTTFHKVVFFFFTTINKALLLYLSVKWGYESNLW